MGQKRAIILSPRDNVASVLEEVLPGETMEMNLAGETLTVQAIDRVPFGFKVAVMDIPADSPVIKYGETIGLASLPIRKGSMVHIHNLAGARGRGDLQNKA
jgi:altronate dehydratase small subunit